jgi:sirohydrochlorin ferrochelatase
VDTGAGGRLEKGACTTRRGIRSLIGGSTRAALPSVGGRVVGICLTPEKNPRAPHEVLLGCAERAVRLARGLAATGSAVPLFLRRSPGAWEYAGEWRVGRVVEDAEAVRGRAAGSGRDDVAVVLLMEECAPAPPDAVQAAGIP